MPILFDPTAKTLTLHTAHTTYQMKVASDGFLLHTYYGPRTDGDLSYLIFEQDRGFSPNPYDNAETRGFSPDALPLEYPCEGCGDYRQTAFGVRLPNGASGCDLRYAGHEITAGKYALPGLPAVYADDDAAETLRVTLEDANAGVRVTLLYGVLPDSDCITRAAVVENIGPAPLTLQNAASMALDVLGGSWELIHFHGRHGNERMPERTPLAHGELCIGSRRGISSHQHNPFVILTDSDTNEDAGCCFGAALLYSGAFSCRAGLEQFESVRLTLGVQEERFEYPLAPGERFVTPEVALIFTSDGLTDLSHKFHALIRGHICRGPWRDKRRPVLVNSWEASFFDINAASLLRLAAQAAELGVEMLVLDDGWFGARNSDNAGLGDWVVNEKKLGMPLKELVQKVAEVGMQFGLWIEPEMVNEDSDLYRAHPDWAFTIPGKPPVLGRGQLVLDFSRPEIVDHIFAQIAAVLDDTGIRYIKMDMNRSLADVCTAAGPQSQGKVLYRYALGVYDFMQRLLDRYPDLLLEGCSGGGGRFDAGMLYYCPQIWCSDDTDAIERTRIQYGTSFAYPVSAIGAHVSAVPNQQTGRITPIDTRAAVAMAGTFGYELDLNLLSEAEKAAVRRQIKDFKRWWPLLHRGLYYRLTDCVQNRQEAAWMMVAPDQSEALATIVKLDAHCNAGVRYLRCKGLDPAARYRADDGRIYPAAALMFAGLPIPTGLPEYGSLQIHLQRI